MRRWTIWPPGVTSSGGDLLDGLEWDSDGTGPDALRVLPFRVHFQVGTVLTIAMRLDGRLAATWYKFDLRLDDGTLLWRHDCHVGHEHLGSGRYHLHAGGAAPGLLPDSPQTLQTIFEKVTGENLRRSWDTPKA